MKFKVGDIVRYKNYVPADGDMDITGKIVNITNDPDFGSIIRTVDRDGPWNWAPEELELDLKELIRKGLGDDNT